MSNTARQNEAGWVELTTVGPHYDPSPAYTTTLYSALKHRKPIRYRRLGGTYEHELVYTTKGDGYEGMCGDCITDAAPALANAVAKANIWASEHGAEPISSALSWNETRIEVNPGDDGDAVLAKWYAILEAERAAYWTPERIAEKAAKEADDRAKLREHYAVFEAEFMPYVRGGAFMKGKKALHAPGEYESFLERLCKWFIALERVTFIHCSLGVYERGEIERLCRFANIQPDMHCARPDPNDDPETAKEIARLRWNKQTRTHKLQWLAGQCLSNTLSMGSPHPVLASMLAKI